MIGDGSNRTALFWGYLLGAAVMIVGGLVEAFLGVNAERKSLEDIAEPLSMVRRTSEALAGYGSGAVARRGVSSTTPMT